jgi:hypothetical protein
LTVVFFFFAWVAFVNFVTFDVLATFAVAVVLVDFAAAVFGFVLEDLGFTVEVLAGFAAVAVLPGFTVVAVFVFFGVGCFVSVDFVSSSFLFVAGVEVLAPTSCPALDSGFGFGFSVEFTTTDAGAGDCGSISS